MPVIRYFRDGGQGHTQNSIRAFFKAADKIVRFNNSSARPVRILINANGLNKPNKRAPFTMRIEYASAHKVDEPYRYVILLSGMQAGYGGEGPHGTATVLRAMGVPEEIVKAVFENKRVEIAWNPWKGFDDKFSKSREEWVLVSTASIKA